MPPAAVTAPAAAVKPAASAVKATASAVTSGLDNIGGHGRGGDRCRLSRRGIGHGRWCGGNRYRGGTRRQHRCDVVLDSHGGTPFDDPIWTLSRIAPQRTDVVTADNHQCLPVSWNPAIRRSAGVVAARPRRRRVSVTSGPSPLNEVVPRRRDVSSKAMLRSTPRYPRRIRASTASMARSGRARHSVPTALSRRSYLLVRSFGFRKAAGSG